VDISFVETLPSGLNKLVHEIVVSLPSGTVLPQTQVQLVIEKLFILWRSLANVD
jgi:hypothetical protein